MPEIASERRSAGGGGSLGYLISADTFSSRLLSTGAARGSPYRRPNWYSLISEIPEGEQRCWETFCLRKACVTLSRKKQARSTKKEQDLNPRGNGDLVCFL